MTPAEIARTSREAQGLPATVEDPAALARVAALLVDAPLREGANDAA